jgi:lipoprotein-releasing system permease protein
VPTSFAPSHDICGEKNLRGNESFRDGLPELWAGVECTVNRVRDEFFHQLERNGHAARRDDLERIAALGVKEAARLIRDYGLTVTGLCRGGMFPAADRKGRQAAIDDNLRALDEAAALGARCLVLIAGGVGVTPFIAILRSLGASPGKRMLIFLVQGAVIAWFGVALGVLLGTLIGHNAGAIAAALERLFRFEVFDSTVYVVTRLPSEMRGEQIAWIAAIAMFITLLATLYPALRASRVPPADALRYE